MSPEDARRFARAIKVALQEETVLGRLGVVGVIPRARRFLGALRADIESSPEMLMPAHSPTVEPSEAGGITHSLHPTVEQASRALLRDRHYEQAVFAAAKALVNAVKTKSGRTDLDGQHLMQAVFSARKPVLTFNELSDASDRDEQQGMMHLYEGAVLAVRNPRAHETVEDSPESARRYLELLSFLAHRLEETAKR